MDKESLDNIIVLTLFTTAFIIYLFVQSLSQLPYGIDGPFYVVESKSIISTGYPHYPDNPIALYIIALLSTITGFYGSVKLFLVIVPSLTVLPLYYLSMRITRRRTYSVLIVLFTYVLSPYTVRLSLEFAKNILGNLLLATAFYYMYVVIVEGGTSKRNLIVLLLLIVLLASTHILVYALLFLSTLIALLYVVLFDRKRVGILAKMMLVEVIATIIGLTTPVMGWEPYKKALLGTTRTSTGLTISFPQVNTEYLIVLMIALLLTYSLFKSYAARPYTLMILAVVVLSLMPLPETVGIPWRIRLMSSIFIPIALILATRIVGRYVVLLAVLISIILLPYTYNVVVLEAKPSIEPVILSELSSTLSYFNDNVYYYVPDKALRYWVQVYVEPDNVLKPKDLGDITHNHRVLIILYTVNPLIKPPEPSLPSRLVYNGTYIYVYELLGEHMS